MQNPYPEQPGRNHPVTEQLYNIEWDKLDGVPFVLTVETLYEKSQSMKEGETFKASDVQPDTPMITVAHLYSPEFPHEKLGKAAWHWANILVLGKMKPPFSVGTCCGCHVVNDSEGHHALYLGHPDTRMFVPATPHMPEALATILADHMNRRYVDSQDVIASRRATKQ